MARRKATAQQAVNSRPPAQEPVSDDTAVGFDQLPLPLVVRDRETGKFVRLTGTVRGER